MLLQHYRQAFRGLPRAVWWLAASALVNRAGTMVLPFLSLYLIEDLQFPAETAGGVLVAWGAGSSVGSVLGGRATDRFGSLRVQQVSLVGAAVGFLAIMVLRDPLAILAAVFAAATVGDAFRPAVMSAVSAVSAEGNRARSFVLLRLAFNLGIAIGPAVGGLLAAVSYRWLFVADAITCAGAAVVLSLALRREDLEDASGAPAPRGSAWKALGDGPFLFMLITTFVLCVAFFQVFTVLPVYYREVYGLSEAVIGGLLGFNGLLIAAVEMLLIARLENRNLVRVYAVGCLLTCGGLGLLPLGAGWLFALGVTVVWSFGEMLSLPMSNAIVADLAERAGSRGTYMGLYTLSFSLSSLAAPALGFWLYASVDPQSPWLVMAAVGLGLFVAGWVAGPRMGRVSS
jgi:predicted MFS family arabinose efflux permease